MTRIGVRATGAVVAFATLLTVGRGGDAAAEIVAAWDFDNVEPGSLTVDASHGFGVIDLGSLGAVSTTFQGTTLNAPFDWGPGNALAFVGAPSEGGGMTISVDDVVGPVAVSFAARRSPTGARWVDAEFWDGRGWVPAATFETGGDWMVHAFEVPKPSELDRVFMRLTPAGTESPNGTIRFDNLVIESAVPSPGGVALAAIAGSRGRRRR